MNFITNPNIEEYLYKLSNIEDEIILEMEKLGHKLNFPIVDRLVGRYLYLITKIKKPKLIVEIGSGFGYSGYWFAKALDYGKVVLTDYRSENLEHAKKFFEKGNIFDKGEFKVGNGIEIAKNYKNIDILFLDHEKKKYKEAVQSLLPNLNENALIIADNTLWHGKVIDKEKDSTTEAIIEFNEFMFNHPDLFSILLSLRDGVLTALKFQ